LNVGVIHGRFQPFHLEHQTCLEWVSGQADEIVVGITNPDPADRTPNDSAPHRHLADANPFPYYLRSRMVQSASEDLGIDPHRIVVVPFPLNRPESWDSYFPRNATHFVTILSEWEEYKAARLEEYGLKVLRKTATRSISGTEIRRRLRESQPISGLVSPAVEELIRRS